jgi:hypothetical protein
VVREGGGDKWASKQPGEAREVRYSVHGPGSCTTYQWRLAGHDQVPDSKAREEGGVASAQFAHLAARRLCTILVVLVEHKHKQGLGKKYNSALGLAAPAMAWPPHANAFAGAPLHGQLSSVGDARGNL